MTWPNLIINVREVDCLLLKVQWYLQTSICSKSKSQLVMSLIILYNDYKDGYAIVNAVI